MHILLFGASGHIGTGLAEHLSSDHEVTGVVRKPPGGDIAYRPLVLPDWVDHPEQVIDALTTGAARSSGSSGAEVDAVIAAIGGWYVAGPLLERGVSSFDEDYASHLRGHYSACRISEGIAARSPQRTPLTHLALNGVASVEALAGSGAISVFGAAQAMLLRVAATESDTVCFRELRILAPVAGDERNDLDGGVRTVSPVAVAQKLMDVLGNPREREIVTELRAEEG